MQTRETLQPLQFDTIENVKASLKRLQKRGLISIRQEIEKNEFTGQTHKKPRYNVLVKEELAEDLAEELVIATDGNTYLLSDILESSEEEIERIGLAKKDNKDGTTVNDFVHNRPLANALKTLKLNKTQFTLKLENTLLSPFPPIFPVITQDEKTEEELRAKEYNLKCKKDSQLIPNNALEELYTYSYKNNETFENYKLGIVALENHSAFKSRSEYRATLCEYPEFAFKDSENELKQISKKLVDRSNNKRKLFNSVAFILGISALVVAGMLFPPATMLYAGLGIVFYLGVCATYVATADNSEAKKIKGVGEAIIDYKKQENAFGDVNLLRAKLTQKIKLVKTQRPDLVVKPTDPATWPKPSLTSRITTCFSGLFYSKPKKGLKPVMPEVQERAAPVHIPDPDVRHLRYYGVHR